MRKILPGLVLILAASCAFGADVFEQIAKNKEAVVPGIVANPAPKLPDIALPWDATPAAGFKPAEKMTTQAQLNAELQRMRDEYAPFLADLAPPIAARPHLELTAFDWRRADKAEETNSAPAIQGLGPWKKVEIPNYGGPVGKVASFYRTEVTLDDSMLSKAALFLYFQGVDYYADVYVNGRLAGHHAGLFDAFEFDIKPLVKPGKNVILVRAGNDGCPIGTTKPGGGNYAYGPKMAACGGPGWNDPEHGWNCCPVGFGLWQRAWLEARPDVFVHDIYVRPLLPKHGAEVWVELGQINDASLTNVEVSYSLYGQNFKAAVAENQTVDAAVQKDDVPLFASQQPSNAAAISPKVHLVKFTVNIPDSQFKMWSLEEPWLYQMQIRLTKDGHVTDAAQRQFGMRSFVQSADSVPKGRFYLNGKEIRLRGANMMGNLMQDVMRKDFNQLRDDILLAKIAHMNFWRMTQQPCQQEVYDYFDRLGLMAQSDMPVFFAIPVADKEEDLREYGALLRMVRSHPCDIMTSYINEPMNGEKGGVPRLSEKQEVELFKSCDTLIPIVAPDQVRKWVDGDYQNLSQGYSDHHCYDLWYWRHAIPFNSLYKGNWVHTRAGWMHGCGEYGAEGLDSIACMKKNYPESWLKESADGKWNPGKIPGCQTSRADFSRWVGHPTTMQDWVDASREHQMCAMRLQTEAYRRDPKMNSTALHLLIDAWPDGWLKSVMDYDRQAKPAYFAFRDALTPLAANLRPDRFYAFSGDPVKIGAWICNDTQEIHPGATCRYQVELGGKVVHTGSSAAKITACEPVFQGWIEFTAPAADTRQPMTVRFGIFGSDGRLLQDTSYDLDLFPASDKGKKPDHPGGRWQFLIDS